MGKSAKREMVDRPFWVSPHAKKQFRRHFGDRPDTEIERLLNAQLQRPKIPDAAKIIHDGRGPALLYAVLIGREIATVVVSAPEYADITHLPRSPGVWPVIITVYPGQKHIIHYQAHLNEIRKQPPRSSFDPWEIETIQLMRWIGYSMAETATLLQIGKRNEGRAC